MEEIWKDIKGYEERYQVSNLGRVRSKTRKTKFGVGYRIYEGQILKQADDKDGYKKIGLSKNGRKRRFFVHRLVGETFIPNEENKPQINHKNGIKYDNNLTNLEWVTPSENTLHGFEKLGRKGNNGGQNKEVEQYDKNRKKVGEFESLSAAAENQGVTVQAISYAVKNGNLTNKGYYWKLV